MEDIKMIIFIILMFYLCYKLFKYLLFPKFIEMNTKEIEKNPKWIMANIQDTYYGFQDIDIILIETNPFCVFPRFRVTKANRFELLVPDYISTKDVDDVLTLAMMGKVNAKYGLLYKDKPLHWLCTLCYMLDGGDIVTKCIADVKENKE